MGRGAPPPPCARDQPGTPQPGGVWLALRVVRGYELYGVAAHDAETLKNYGRGTPQDWLERRLYSAYPHFGIVVFRRRAPVAVRRSGIVMNRVHPRAQPFFAGGVINGLGHAVGYRSFEMPSTATNLVPWALLLAAGAAQHHHAFPALARVLRCSAGRSTSAGCGYACSVPWGWPRRALGRSAPQLERRRRDLDADTVNALFTNRMHVLRDYARRVGAARVPVSWRGVSHTARCR